MNNLFYLPKSDSSYKPEEKHFEKLLSAVVPISLLLQNDLLKISDPPSSKIKKIIFKEKELKKWILKLFGKDKNIQDSLMRLPHEKATRFGSLAANFSLSALEYNILLMILMPCLDKNYGIIFSEIQRDSKAFLPTQETVIRLLGSYKKQAYCLSCFSPQAVLLHYHLIEGVRNRENSHERSLKIDPYIYHFLIGIDYLPDQLKSCAKWLKPSKDWHEYNMELISILKESNADNKTKSIILLKGARGGGREHAACQAIAEFGFFSFCLYIELLPEQDEEAITIFCLALRETKLRNGCLILHSIDSLVASRKNLLSTIGEELERFNRPVICLTEPGSSHFLLGNKPHFEVTMSRITFEAKCELLENKLPSSSTIGNLEIGSLARCFPITPYLLDKALYEANVYRCQRGESELLNEFDLRKALRFRSQQDYGQLAKRVEPVRTWDDLVISSEIIEQLEEVLASIRQRDIVLEKGFARKIGYGSGISALFYGESGTGKTMAAEVLAGMLGVDLIKVDLSKVVNKYIGETEKHLARLFDMAEMDSGVLFFDEADALFGKRTETKDAHDRFANIEVSYLLQRVENFPGLVVLSTNNRSHLDKAFDRRLTFTLHFKEPDTELREVLWRSIWPEKIKLDNDVDLSHLAETVKLTGSNIRNIALFATWLSEDEGSEFVALKHIEQAMKRETDKIGRIIF